MKKVAIITSIVVLLLMIASIVTVGIVNNNNKKMDVNLITWYDCKKKSNVVQIPKKTITYSLPYGEIAYLGVVDEESIEYPNYIDYSLNVDSTDTDGKLIFVNDCYYFLSPLYVDTRKFTVRLMASEVTYMGYQFNLPINSIQHLSFSAGNVELAKKSIEEYFSNVSFEDICALYDKPNDNYLVKPEDKEIIFNCMDLRTKNMLKVSVNYIDKCFYIINSDGTKLKIE